MTQSAARSTINVEETSLKDKQGATIKSFSFDKLKRYCINNIVYLMIILVSLAWFYMNYGQADEELTETVAHLNSPKINDLYFLDFRVLSDNLRPNEKYRLAKVVDITGDVVTFLYSDFFYNRERDIKESIRFGHLRYQNYFQTKRYDFTLNQLKSMYDASAIFLIKRPFYNRLYGNLMTPYIAPVDATVFIPGKNENTKGEAYFNSKNIEGRFESAFNYFSESAEIGYAIGQLNLAEMYINGQHVEQDFSKALYWLLQASLQSHKPAILKYVIVCKQVELCDLYDFYQFLEQSGVNIRVRNHDFTLSSADELF